MAIPVKKVQDGEMERTDSKLLEQPALQVVSWLALKHLADASAAQKRLGHPQDHHALHDFRVAVRRLRSCLRSHRQVLKPAIDKKVRRSFKALVQKTNSARDAEVALQWLQRQAVALPPSEQVDVLFVVQKYQKRRAKVLQGGLGELKDDFLEAELRLRAALSSSTANVWRQRTALPYGKCWSSLVEAQATQLVDQIRLATKESEASALHALRIEAKRLRYLLEPVEKELPELEQPIRELKALQELLGELHDLQLMALEIQKRRGLKVLAGLARAQERVLLGRYQKQWRTQNCSHATSLLSALNSVISSVGSARPSADFGPRSKG